MRDYVYVSRRKVERLAATLPPKVAKRLRELSITAGPVAANIVLSDWPVDTVAAAVGEIESALHREHHVRYFTDEELRGGHWFMADSQDMAYGVQRISGEPSGAAVFVAEQGDVQLLLSGSAEYLLDRHVPETDVRASMSDPQAIARLLSAVTEDSANSGVDAPRPWPDGDDYPMANIFRVFARYGFHPLAFLARAIRVSRTVRGAGRIVLGTPLYVAHAVPE